jgi:hypothetical protein
MRSVQAQLSQNTITQLNIVLNFSVAVTGTLDSTPFNVTLNGSLLKGVNNLPVSASTDYAVPWSGSFRASQKGLVFSDMNLFDGVNAAILTSVSTADSRLFSIIDYVAQVTANVDLRLDPMGTLPSSIFESTRQKFLPVSVLPSATSANVIGGNLYGATTPNSSLGGLIQVSGSCTGSSCSDFLVSAWQQYLPGGCTSAQPVESTLNSQLSIDMFITNSTIVLRSVAARSEALFSCSGGYIALVLSVTSSEQASWPVGIFLTDPNAQIGLAKSVEIIPYGHLSGVVTTDQLYSVLNEDLFGSSPSGLLVPDAQLTQAAISQIFTQATNTLQTTIPAFNAVIQSTFSNVANLISEYSAVDQQPTVLRFLQWFDSNNDQVDVNIHNGTSMTIAIALAVETQLSQSDPAIQAMDKALSSLGITVNSTYQSARSYSIPSLSSASTLSAVFKGVLAGSATLSLGSVVNATLDAPVISLATVTTTASFTASKAMFTCANITYNYADASATVQVYITRKIYH